MRVNEIFKSIEGEGIRTGFPATFIRLHGCNLNCSYCDTRYGCEGTDYTDMGIPQILQRVHELGVRRVTLTGGEPLIHQNVKELVGLLVSDGIEVNIETNGSVDIYPYIFFPEVIITMDWKSYTSGMENKMLSANLKYLRPQDVLKFVVGNEKDLKNLKSLLEKEAPTCSVFISPVFGKIEPHEIVEFVLDNNLVDCRVQVQLHKIIWDPSKRGV